ncbi:FAD-dependent oxidoreductase [Myceligenerans xiligouense]|uniref:2-polyprenyl-6-methoxyphenol hydroxylase-like FAD-dependent oxidoreductase n=1 Tax=Myceligenerans xiligouense TaxID=253184 RepID=A0A3N4YPI0_9MICO|nr:FAD-dependent oxidoreductase [Myceligenerans xiligouense]RPF20390.1 2-polyprenyl-6-methoxyphenol hydroxylase-like FAD-dependent oxidoreductase [Myceligenerans xiligouense]
MTDVIVVGAGPTGLLLAGDLAEAGLSVTLLERRGSEISNLSRAFGVHARTLEQLDARGLADPLVKRSVGRVADARLFAAVHVHFDELPSRFPFLLVSPQYTVEQVLRERAVDAGADLVHDAEFTDLTQDDTGVVVRARDADGTVTSRRAAYVVGTDGVRSRVRDAIGQPFPGESVIRSIMLADVRLAEEPEEALTVNGNGDEFAFLAPFGDGWWRVFCWDRRADVPESAPLDLDEVRAVTRRALGTDHGMSEARWTSRFHSDERQVPEYRVGRVFLAGDAAHCHSPAGGMGMNTGLQDAANLSWKLAAVLRGAPESLLDTYHSERHPVGREVLQASGTLIRLAMLRSGAGRAVRGLLGGTAIKIPAVHSRAIGRLSGVGFDYDAPGGADRRVGDRVPDQDLADGRRLYEALHGGRFVLLSPGGTADVDGWADRVRVVAPAEDTGECLLVRPDGYVGAITAPGDTAAIREALTGLCGAPSAQPSATRSRRPRSTSPGA